MKKSFEEIYNYCCKLLSYKDRSINEIKEKLRQRSISENIISLVIDKLIQNRFLDDKRFVENYIEKNLRKAKSLNFILNEVIEKYKVNKNILDNINLENYKSLQEKYAIELLKKKYKSFNVQKIYRFLSSNGFEEDEIFRIIGKFNNKEK